MESLIGIIDLVSKTTEMLNQLIGIELQLMFPVLILVSLIAGLSNLKERWPNYKNSLLASLAFILGCIVAMLADWSVCHEAVIEGLKLGAMSAFTYQFWKPFVRGGAELLKKKYKEKTGQELKLPDEFM